MHDYIPLNDAKTCSVHLDQLVIFGCLDTYSIAEVTCLGLFTINLNLNIGIMELRDYITLDICVNDNIVRTLVIEPGSRIIEKIDNIPLDAGWYQRHYVIYAKCNNVQRALLNLAVESSGVIRCLTSRYLTYLQRIFNHPSNHNFDLWYPALSMHLGEDINQQVMNRSGIHTLLQLYQLEYYKRRRTMYPILSQLLSYLGVNDINDINLFMLCCNLTRHNYCSSHLMFDLNNEIVGLLHNGKIKTEQYMELLYSISEVFK